MTGLPVWASISLRVLPATAPQPLVNPLLGVAILFVEFLHPAHGQLGVFDLVKPLLADSGQPPLERFSLGAGDGLNQAEDAFGIPALEFLTPTNPRKLQGGGTNCPPLGGLCPNPDHV